MKLFISWSRPLSKAHALCFREWLPKVFQGVEAFMSDQDISLGQRGIPAIENQLDEIDFGVVFVTRENQDAPWIHYEAGALSRAVAAPESRVIPMLVDLSIGDLGASPLSGYQGKPTNRDGVFRLCRSVNECLERNLSDARLAETFDMWWPKLEECWGKIERGERASRPEATLDSIAGQVDELTKLVASLRNAERTQTRALQYLTWFTSPGTGGRNKLSNIETKNALSEYSLSADKLNRALTNISINEDGEAIIRIDGNEDEQGQDG